MVRLVSAVIRGLDFYNSKSNVDRMLYQLNISSGTKFVCKIFLRLFVYPLLKFKMAAIDN